MVLWAWPSRRFELWAVGAPLNRKTGLTWAHSAYDSMALHGFTMLYSVYYWAYYVVQAAGLLFLLRMATSLWQPDQCPLRIRPFCQSCDFGCTLGRDVTLWNVSVNSRTCGSSWIDWMGSGSQMLLVLDAFLAETCMSYCKSLCWSMMGRDRVYFINSYIHYTYIIYIQILYIAGA